MLFPKKEGVAKKGLIPDSTDLKVADQNTDAKLLGVTPLDTRKREKAVKITKAMKDVKVYEKLRIERVNKYYKGKRDNKRKEEENKKKQAWFIAKQLY